MTNVLFKRIYFYLSDTIINVINDYLITIDASLWRWRWASEGVWVSGINFTNEDDAIAFKLKFQL